MKNAFADFNKLIEGQFRYGGEKYKSTNKKEATDELFDAYGFSWLIGGIDKYTYRFKNLSRERDLLKISAYMYITWLKRGFHLNSLGTKHPIDTTVEIKTKYFTDFILSTFNYYDLNKFYLETYPTEDALNKISSMLKEFSLSSWLDISENSLLQIYCLSFVIWNNKYYISGKAGSDTDTENEEKYLTKKLTDVAISFFGTNEPHENAHVDEEEIEVLVKAQVKALLKKKD